jgi:hypothetical protein
MVRRVAQDLLAVRVDLEVVETVLEVPVVQEVQLVQSMLEALSVLILSLLFSSIQCIQLIM